MVSPLTSAVSSAAAATVPASSNPRVVDVVATSRTPEAVAAETAARRTATDFVEDKQRAPDEKKKPEGSFAGQERPVADKQLRKIA